VVAIELYVLSEDDELEVDGMSRVRIGIGADGEPDSARMTTSDGRPLNLVFRALFKEARAATEWEYRVKERLEKSGVQLGSEFFFVSDAMVQTLCDAAAHADDHEWLIAPSDDDFVRLAMELSQAKLEVDETFERWSASGWLPSAEIKINSYTQHVARNDRRVKDLQGKYVTPRFYNDAAVKNTQLDYAISRLKEENRNWETEIARLKRTIEESELAFAEWQAAVRRVDQLETAIAAVAPSRGDSPGS